MSILDIPIILGVLFFVVLGYRDGLLKKVYAVAGSWLGLIIATRSMYYVGESFTEVFNIQKEVAHILSFSAVFFIFILLENFVYRRWGSAGEEGHKLWSRIGGAIVGGVQGFVAVSIVLILCIFLNIPPESSKKESMFYPPMFHAAPILFDYSTSWMPESKTFVKLMKDHFQDINVPQ